jgi:hypothetical protein
LNHGHFETAQRGRGGFVLVVLGIGTRHELNDTASGGRFKRFVEELGLGVSLFYARGRNCIKNVRDSP